MSPARVGAVSNVSDWAASALLKSGCPPPSAPSTRDRLQGVVAVQMIGEGGHQGFGDDQHPRPAVFQHERVVARGQPRVHRDRHRARPDRAQEADGPGRRIQHAEQDPLFHAHALGAQQIGEAVRRAVQLGVGHRAHRRRRRRACRRARRPDCGRSGRRRRCSDPPRRNARPWWCPPVLGDVGVALDGRATRDPVIARLTREVPAFAGTRMTFIKTGTGALAKAGAWRPPP
jgi:hypothetical protein